MLCEKIDVIEFAGADFQPQNLVVIVVLVTVVKCKVPYY